MLFRNEKTGAELDISFRPFQPGDERGFRECIEDFYGDGYPSKEYFEPGYLAEKCASGDMLVLCGVTGEGEIVNTCAIRYDGEFPGSGLMLLRVVKKKCRGMGVGREQERVQLECAARRGGASLYADVMTHDCVSQHGLWTNGFVLTGLRPVLYRASEMVPGREWPEGARLSQAVMCRAGSARAAELYCPPEHTEAVGRIYSLLGVEPKFRDGTPGTAPGRSQIRESVDAGHGSRVWIIGQPGADLGERLGQVKEQAFLCYLNLCAPGAAEAYAAFKSRGFVFAGMKPLNGNGEFMLLAAPGLRGTWTDTLHIDEPGQWLIEYIMGC